MRRASNTIPPVRIEFVWEGDVGLFRLAGELDLAAAPELRQRIASFIEHNRGARLVLDFEEVVFVDSTVLGVFVRAARLAEEDGATVAVRNASGSIRRVFELTGIDRLLAAED